MATTATGAKKVADGDNWRTVIPDHNDTVDVYDALLGTTALPTTAQTLTGAIAEQNQAIANLDTKTNYRTIQQKVLRTLNSSGSETTTGITSYPTATGIYRVVGNIAGFPDGSSQYGSLLIFDAGSYSIHLYFDVGSTKRMYFASTSSVTTPTSWYLATTTSVGVKT